MYYKGSLIVRMAGKLRRDAMRLPIVRALDGYKYLQALEAHSSSLPPLDARDLLALQLLREVGVCAMGVDEWHLPGTEAMLAAAHRLADELRSDLPAKDNAPRVSTERLMQFPEVYFWGLNERLLSVAENYIQLPVHYEGVSIRREIADGMSTDVRQWHLDPDDRRMCRMILYLNPVQEGGGPFEYIERTRTRAIAHKLHYASGFVSERRMATVSDQTAWRQVLGPHHHAVLADTCRVFHRAQAPRFADRYTATFTWKSRTPLKRYPAEVLPDEIKNYVRLHGTPRQWSVMQPA